MCIPPLVSFAATPREATCHVTVHARPTSLLNGCVFVIEKKSLAEFGLLPELFVTESVLCGTVKTAKVKVYSRVSLNIQCMAHTTFKFT